MASRTLLIALRKCRIPVSRKTLWPMKPSPYQSLHATYTTFFQPTTSGSLQRRCVAQFHTSLPRSILPAGPQVIDGTVNDPAPVPKPSPTHGSYHWTFERVLSVGLIPLTITPFAYGSLNPVLDAVFVTAILLHSHIGFSTIITDYIPNKQHPAARNFFSWGLKVATLVVGIGFYEFETNDVGLTEGLRRIWRAKSKAKVH